MLSYEDFLPMSLMLAIVYPGVFRQLVFNDHCRRRQLLAELDQALEEFGPSFQPSPEERLAGRSVRVRNLCRTDSGNQGYLADEHVAIRSEQHTSELQSLMRTSHASFCLIKKNT